MDALKESILNIKTDKKELIEEALKIIETKEVKEFVANLNLLGYTMTVVSNKEWDLASILSRVMNGLLIKKWNIS